MLVLTLRTDKPEAEIGLFDTGKQLDYQTWQAHRQLAETIHARIKELLDSQNHSLDDLGGIVVFQGPGSFTGLRIGLSVTNALADSLRVPIIGETGDSWVEKGLQKIQNGQNDKLVLPKYGSPPHITQPKH